VSIATAANALLGLLAPRKFYQTLNNLALIEENQCSPSWSLLVDTAIPAAGDAILFLISPSPLEILRRWLHPKAIRGPRGARPPEPHRRASGRSGRAARSWQFGLPEPAEWLAAILPGKSYLAARVPAKLERMFWIGVDRAELVLWWWLVLGTVEEFFYEWSSGIVESRFCTSTYLLRYDADSLIPPPHEPWNTSLDRFTPVAGEGLRVVDGFLQTDPPGGYFSGYAVATATVRNPSDTLNATSRAQLDPDDPLEHALAPGESFTYGLQWNFRHVKKIAFTAGGGETYDEVTAAHIAVWANPDAD
jgi:hypothetical protein